MDAAAGGAEMIAFQELLARNYSALGFELLELEIVPREQDDQHLVTGKILCPCGGTEYFSFKGSLTDDTYRDVARGVLLNTASREHLEADIAAGTLSPFDLEGHVFKELV